MPNEQKVQKIRAALAQLDPTNDSHWTDDGLPREGIVRKLASDTTLSRRDISEAQPGFQRHPKAADAKPVAADSATNASPGEGAGGEPAKVATEDPLTGEPLDAGQDPSKNEGEYMTEDEVKTILEQRVKDATQALADRQHDLRDAQKAVETAQTDLRRAKEDLVREFPPMTKNQNVKQYIASEVSRRAMLAGHGYGGGLAPGSQIDMAMQRSNSRGWRRPTRQGQTQTGAAR